VKSRFASVVEEVRLIATFLGKDRQTLSNASPPEFIFVHSHRRSGTHFLIDTISGWFDVVPGFCHFPAPAPGSALALPNTRLVKSHEPIYGFVLNEKHLWASERHLDEHRSYYQNNPHIYIVRNPFFVLRSQYVFDLMGGEPKFQVDKNLSFREYVLGRSRHELNLEGKNRIEYWEQHVRNWASRPDVVVIDYDDLLLSTPDTVGVISQHVKCQIRSSPRSIPPTGIGRELTDRFLKGGREPVWEPDLAELMKAKIERLGAVEPRMCRHVDHWLAVTPSGAGWNRSRV
jgi:hypothetical protein